MPDVTDRLRRSIATIKERVAAMIEPAAMIETEDADDRREDDDFTAMVTAKLRPRPYRGSGAIALREPEM